MEKEYSKKNKRGREFRTYKKILALQKKGVGCNRCGYNKNMAALHFHHIDSKRELKYGSTITYLGMDDMFEEIKKCEVLCSNCHQEEHNKKLEITDPNDEFLGIKMNITFCLYCGGRIADVNEGVSYCSTECRDIGTRKVEWPSKEELTKLIQEKSFLAISKMFGVSDNAIRKWAKHYGIFDLRKKPKTGIKECEFCGKEFKTLDNRFCSYECSNLALFNGIPDQNILKEELKTKTHNELAQEYNVDVSTVYRWIRYMNSPKNKNWVEKHKIKLKIKPQIKTEVVDGTEG